MVSNPDSASINPVGKHKSGSKPDLDQIWDQKFSTSVCSLEIDTAGTNFNRALEGGDFTVLIYYLLLHHQGDRGTKTKWEIFMFCLRGSKNNFSKILSSRSLWLAKSKPDLDQIWTKNFQHRFGHLIQTSLEKTSMEP